MAEGRVDPDTLLKVNLFKSRLKDTLSDIKGVVEQGRLVAQDASQLFLFKGMFRELKHYWDSFNDLFNTLGELHASVDLPPFPSESEKNYKSQAKRYFYEACAIYESHMNPTPVAEARGSPAEGASRNSTLNESSTVRARLPQINLPVFSGSHADWPLFRDTYTSLIHGENSLSKIEKFHFLVSSLRGPALSLVRNIPLLEANYDQAWKALNDTFDDKRHLASSYLKALLNFSPFRNKPTANNLKYFITTALESVSAFQQLRLENAEDFILTYLLLRCLDPTTRRDFEKQVSDEEFPTLASFTKFIKAEWKSLEYSSEESKNPSFKSGSSSKSFSNHQKSDAALYADNNRNTSCPWSSKGKASNRNCPACKTQHTLYQCNTFKSSSPEEKIAMLKGWSGCLNCLSFRHKVDSCPSTRGCQTCNRRHHSWLHTSTSSNSSTNPESRPANSSMNPESRPQASALSGIARSGNVILGTALAKLQDCDGKFHVIRLVTDCGSQQSFVTKKCVDRLGLRYSPTATTIAGIGQFQLPKVFGVVDCTLRPRYKEEEFHTTAMVVPDITGNLPRSRLSAEMYNHFSAYELADPTYRKPQEIDFLIGADLYFDLITGAPLTLQENLPKLVPSKLGHIVAGRAALPSEDSSQVSLFVKSQIDLQGVMNQFWEIESVSKPLPLSKEEEECEKLFQATHYRLPSGRYVVALPFKCSFGELRSPQQQVLSRFHNLEHKLSKAPTLKQEYQNFMDEYLGLSHMQPALQPTKYLIPHHAVTKTENGKTKLRVVFDASCRGPAGSLNDHLLVGPKLQLDIADILISFRTYEVVLVADIIKMYRQILVRPEDRPYQHILWRSEPSDALQTMELMTVTYGENSSPYLAIRTLLQLVKDEGAPYPRAAKVIQKSSYMDDFVTGANSIEEAFQLQAELIALLRLGGFELAKWKSNRPEILRQVQDSGDGDQLSFSGDDSNTCKILGLKWSSSADIFTFEVEKPTAPHTKRGILSTIARIYDPLGFLAPVVFRAKTILQDVWLSKCDWDDLVPLTIQEVWSTFAADLPQLTQVQIPRFAGLPDPVSYDLIGFSDASQRGYAASLYLRACSQGAVKVHLLKAKTKLAPTKLTSIPRLELCGALLLAQLVDSCKRPLEDVAINQIHLFTDSTIVLGWLNLPVNRLKAFVAHRVAAILEIIPSSSWHYISSESNPADCASRGLMPQDISSHELWWSGPSWLITPPQTWPLSVLDYTQVDLPETKPTDTLVLIAEGYTSLLDWMTGCSSYLKLLRAIAISLRFIKRLRGRQISERIGLDDMEEARLVCIRLVQESYVSSKENITSSKFWLSLSPFKDSQGVFRVGGRLEHSRLSFSAKHPIILPNSHFTRLLVDYYHQANLHIGSNSLQAVLQNRYYIISARKVIRSRIRHCVRCQVSAPKPHAPLMGNLPPFRLDEGQIFQHVGVDLGGPFPLKESLRRKAALGKAYLCLFICMVTKAVHLEVVTSCSTEAFVAALHRFTSRRGRPQHMYSDCGTNFVGASAELKKLRSWYAADATQRDLHDVAAKEEIRWHFNPPYAPHFGGIWEAGIKSAKTLLSKNLASTPLTYEELATLFCRIEAVLNSRPISPMDNDPNGLECLTPGHFLIGRPLTALPEQSLLDVKESRLRRWQLVQQRVQDFWRLWRSAYLNQLQQRRKWTSPQTNLKEGDLVIIKDSCSPPTRWPMARVISTHPGSDDIVRVVTIRTTAGIFKRPVVKLVPLQLPNHNDL